MSALIPLAMFGWVGVVLVLFWRLQPRRAAIVAFAAGWMFLPCYTYVVSGIPDWSKVNATSYGVLLGSMVFDYGRWLAFKPRAIDLVAVLWGTCPILSSLTNGLGLYDGISESIEQVFKWGVPYLIAQVYLADLEGLRELSIGWIYAGIAYVPFCLYEIRFAPTLHYKVYGYAQHDFSQTVRFGGYRPMVFMEHGLMVGMWMTVASLAATWLWFTRAQLRLRLFRVNFPMWLVAGGLWGVTFLCKSSGALGLGIAGFAVLLISRQLRTPVLLILLFLVPVFYCVGRTSGWSGEEVVDFLQTNFDRERAASIQFRFDNENILMRRALEMPAFGWGWWKRSRVVDSEGKDITVADGLWIITLGERGLWGLLLLGSLLLLPAARAVWLCPPWRWRDPHAAYPAFVAMVAVLFVIDSLINSMLTPMYLLGAGALATANLSLRPTKQKRQATEPVARANPLPAGRRRARPPSEAVPQARSNGDVV